LPRRAAVAATFAASLELARTGRIELRQEGLFGPIYMRRGSGDNIAPETVNTEGTQ
jgi:segregation and condensation protein A